jgi:hypothetical protein
MSNKEPIELWYNRDPKFYNLRSHKQYGHFLRDNLMYIFWYLTKAKLLHRNDWKIYWKQWARGFHPHFIEFTNHILPNIEFTPKGEGDEYIPSSARKIKYVCSPWKQFVNWRRPWKYKPVRDERFNNYVKWMVDPFRDYVFEKYEFKPEKKRRLLYIPRIGPDRNEKGEWIKAKGATGTTQRVLDNIKYEDTLKEWCRENDYEYSHWLNNSNVSIIAQAKMYAESDIVIGVTGTDFINAYWMDSKSLIIELIPPAEHFPGGDCESFKSEATIKSLKENWGNKWAKGYNLDNACERNLKLIYAPEYEITRHGSEIIISRENINDTIDILNGHINKQVEWEI